VIELVHVVLREEALGGEPVHRLQIADLRRDDAADELAPFDLEWRLIFR
jgi:hypothetical protein